MAASASACMRDAIQDSPLQHNNIPSSASLGEDLVALTATVDGLLAVSATNASGSGHSKQASKRQAAAAAKIVQVLDRFLYPTVRAVQVADRSLVLQDGANESSLVISQWLLKRVIQWTAEAPSPGALSDRMIRSWFRFHTIVGTLSTFVVLVTSVPHAIRILLRYGRISDPFIASQIRLCAFGVFQLAIASLHVITKEGRDSSLTNLILTGALATLQCSLSCLRGVAQLFRAFVVVNDTLCQEVLDWEFQVATRVIQFVQRRGVNQQNHHHRCGGGNKQSGASLAQLPGHTLHDGGSSFRCILRRMCFRPPATKTAAATSQQNSAQTTSADACSGGGEIDDHSGPLSPYPTDDSNPFLGGESSSSDRLVSATLLQSKENAAASTASPSSPASSPRVELEVKMMDYCRLLQPILFERFPSELGNLPSMDEMSFATQQSVASGLPNCRMCRHDEALADKLRSESHEHSSECIAQELFPHLNDVKSAFLVRRRLCLHFSELKSYASGAYHAPPQLQRRGSGSGSMNLMSVPLEKSFESSRESRSDTLSELAYLKHSNIASLMTIILPEQFISTLAPLVARLVTTPSRSLTVCPHMRQVEAKAERSKNRHYVLETLIRRVWALTPVGQRWVPCRYRNRDDLSETTAILVQRLHDALLGSKSVASSHQLSDDVPAGSFSAKCRQNSSSTSAESLVLPQSQQQLKNPDAPEPPLPTFELIQEATDLCPAIRAAVLAGSSDPSLVDVHLQLMVTVLSFLDRSLVMSPPPVVQLVDGLTTLLLAAEHQRFATKRLCAVAATRELLLRAFCRCRCAASICCTSKSIREKMFEFASRLRIVYPPIGVSLESSLAQGAAVPRSYALVNNKTNNVVTIPTPSPHAPTQVNGMSSFHHIGDAPSPRCPFAPATSGSELQTTPSSPHSPSRVTADTQKAPAAHSNEPWSWSSLSLAVLMSNLSQMWMCTLSAHILPESLRPSMVSPSVVRAAQSPRSTASSIAVRVTSSRELVASKHYGGDGLDHVTEFFRSIVCTLRCIVAIYRRAIKNCQRHQRAKAASKYDKDDLFAAVEGFVVQIVLPTLEGHHDRSEFVSNATTTTTTTSSPPPATSSQTSSSLARLTAILDKIDDGFTRGSVTLSGSIQQRLLQFHFMIKDKMTDHWNQRVVSQRSSINVPVALVPVATTKDLGRHLATVISGTYNYSVITRFSADQLEPYNAFGALLLRMAAAPALLLLQKGADGMAEKSPETTLLKAFVPSMLQTRFKLRDIIDQYPSQRMAASLLKELGTAAIRAIHSWTMHGIPLADASNGVRSNTPTRFPFCAAGLRSRIMVDLLTCDMFRPLHTNEPLQVLGQVRLQLIDWLCRENRRHLIDLAGSTITPATMRRLVGSTEHFAAGASDGSTSDLQRRVGFPPVSILHRPPSLSSLTGGTSSSLVGAPPPLAAAVCPFSPANQNECSSDLWSKLLPLASQLSTPGNDRVLTVVDLFQRRLAHGKTLQQNQWLLADSSNPLQIMATVQLCFEETRWRCVTNTEVLPGALGASLEEACRFTATLVEPWCMSLCPPEPTTAWSVRCPFMLDPSRRVHVEKAASQQRCPWLRRGAIAEKGGNGWTPPSIAASSSTSNNTTNHPVYAARGQGFLLMTWWEATRCLNQSRWLAQEASMILLHGSRQAVRDLIILHRARVALLALISARGSQVFPPHSKLLALLQSIPTVEWLPVIEQLLSIAASLFIRGDHDGSQLVVKLLESTSCDFPEQAVWYLLMRQHFRHNSNAYYNTPSTASVVGGGATINSTVGSTQTSAQQQQSSPKAPIHVNTDASNTTTTSATNSNHHQPTPNSSAVLQLQQARIACELLYAVTARSHEQRLLVETMALVHRILRGIAVLPVEQLVADVKFLTAAVQQCELHYNASASNAMQGAAASTALAQQTKTSTTPSPGSFAVEMLRDIQGHFIEFDQHIPATEFERFMRIELLPFVRQMIQLMTKHQLPPPSSAHHHSHHTVGTFDLAALMRESANIIAALKERLDSIMATLTRTVALSSIVSEKQLSQLTALLAQRGVVLLDVRDLMHMSPGLWPTHRQAVASRAVDPLLTVFPSAQRPKRVTFQSSASSKQTKSHFLVKGHEDLRQDQRLQRLLRVFALTAPHTMLRLSTYSVIPLSTTSGLVEWVPESETIGRLVQQYRGLAGIPMQREAFMIKDLSATASPPITEDMQQLLGRYDTLEVHEKLRVFRLLVPAKLSSPAMATRRMAEIGGVNRSLHCELHHMLLSGAQTAASFISRRRAFLESLATMSVLGDVIGLGDRHPSNILVDKSAFHVTHIDFGDAFGVAQRRSRFPEHVPFRATRMLERCLGVDGFGTVGSPFQLACTNVGCMFADGDNNTSWLRGALVLELLLPFLDEDDVAVAARVPGSVAMARVAANMAAYTTASNQQGDSSVSHHSPFYSSLAKRMSAAYTRYSSTVTPANSLPGSPLGGKLSSLPEAEVGQAAAVRLQRWWRSGHVLLRRQHQNGDNTLPLHAAKTTTFVDEVEVYAPFSARVRPFGTSAPRISRPRHDYRSPVLGSPFTVATNVQRLVEVATLDENVSRHYSGWNPFW